MRRALAASLVLVAGTALLAQDFPLPAPARLVTEREKPLDRYELPVGPWSDEGLPIDLREGRVVQQSWRIDNPSLTTLQAGNPIRAALEAKGYEIVLDCLADTCGGFDFRFGIDVIPSPDMYVDLRDFLALSAVRGEDALNVIVSRGQGAVWIQETRVTGTGPTPDATAPDVPRTEASPVPVQAGDFESGLAAMGFATFDDLDFGTGSTALGDGPYASLETLATLLGTNPDLRIALVGHTDLSGSLEVNISVSERRAQAVRDRLVSGYGIAPDRIEARGIGYLAPRATTLTEAGHRANRRVEVILLP